MWFFYIIDAEDGDLLKIEEEDAEVAIEAFEVMACYSGIKTLSKSLGNITKALV